MARSIALCVLMLVLLCAAASAQQRPLGLGVIVGEPTGVTGKWWTGGRTAIDAALAWSFADENAMHLHADYLVHNFDMFELGDAVMPFYFGVGGRLKLEDDSRFGMRIPVGIAYVIAGTPLDLFLELVPVLDLAPETELRLNGAFGMRYFF
ncbi:hypothetical protein AMJ39_04060 [candidate division TA06 bacterium DG_24]|jgi:hypothetical protein|uniref:DUF3996 domain-containing protein n=3 Tax=Bacteria division TA06 TaxID=1156500 RepID=A0A0S8JQ47_UNCT6|nr:MAG: hypothetical protein AMJ39_04060 [candidate division TA06 bacterium DG_24]KPK70643.1 MAG: hypothetical protein AMJ82_02525 [candidate division TA06 bacterium SM23_40]KPL10933.1 MAG: hypothetical protein AMJ71_01285 [candidate division TA06 bacterium SM1_40]